MRWSPAWGPPQTLAAILLLVAAAAAGAGNARIDVTGGATGIEGAAGGGLVPWALIAGYASAGEIGGSAFATRARVDDLELDVHGFALAFEDRVELSAARQTLHVEPLDLDLRQEVIGLKVRLAGRLPYTPMPQVSLGVQYKRNLDHDSVPASLGAERSEDFDVYLAASKLFFAALAGRNVFVNGNLRWSRAYETGLLGFGDDDRDLLLEGSAGVFLTDRLVLGAEYRQKPEGLAGFAERDWMDLFVAWFPTRHVSLTLAHVDLGDVVQFEDQQGWYLSLEGSF